MQVVLVMKRLVDFLAERLEIFRPPLACSEVRVFGIELESIPLCQAIEHGIDHIVQFYAEATVNAGMVDESLAERTVDLLIRRLV
jgi:hypothetical protein